MKTISKKHVFTTICVEITWKQDLATPSTCGVLVRARIHEPYKLAYGPASYASPTSQRSNKSTVAGTMAYVFI